MSDQVVFKLTAKTFQGLEEALASELRMLGAKNIEVANRAVRFEGDLKLLYMSNLHLRTALRILMEVDSFEAKNEDELYQAAGEIPWENIFDIEDSFAVDAVLQSDVFRHSKFTALRVKDAIADRFRNRFRQKPNVDFDHPDIKIDVFVSGTTVQISIDSSGAPLFKRGNRVVNTEIPAFNEVLAAGMVLLSGWDGEGNFADPMCGTGTVLIEAGMYAKNIAPGSFREHFGFMNWNYGDAKLWEKVVADAKAAEKSGNFKLFGSDTSKHALTVTRKDLISSGLGGKMTIDSFGFEQMRLPTGGGKIMMIPPLMSHLDPVDTATFYKRIGKTLEERGAGYEAWMLSGSLEGLKSIGLEAKHSISIWNGRIECKFLCFQL